MGSWKNATVLFLHSNKLESLPEEMGDMQKLKVINLSNNKWVLTDSLQFDLTLTHPLSETYNDNYHTMMK